MKFPSLPETFKCFDWPESTLLPVSHMNLSYFSQGKLNKHQKYLQMLQLGIMEGNNQTATDFGKKKRQAILPLPSTCLDVPSCLFDANLSPFLNWLISSFPVKKFEPEKSQQRERKQKRASNHSRTDAHTMQSL